MIAFLLMGLLSIRLATTYLTREELGIWNFVFATVSYFAFLELGLGPGIARLLADPLAKGDQEKANSMFTTGVAFLGIQAVLFISIGLLLRKPLLLWGGVPLSLWAPAEDLWTGVVLVRALTLPFVLLNAILWAQNRAYWIFVVSTVCPWIGLFFFAWALHHGGGLRAYIWNLSIPAVLNSFALICAVVAGPHAFRLRVRSIRWSSASEIWGYSWAVFVASGAAQLSSLSQTVIVTRICGLDATAAFGVTSRLPGMLMGVVTKPFDSFVPRWSAAFCQTGVVGVKREFIAMARFSLLAVTATGIGVCLVNPGFVKVWTKPEFYGGSLLNVLLAFMLIYQMISRTFSYAFTMRKHMTGFAIASLFSVIIELTLQAFFASRFGPAGVVIGYLIAVFGFLFWYILRNGSLMLEARASEVFLPDLVWWLPSFSVAVLLCFAKLPPLSHSSWASLFLATGVGLTLCLPIAWRCWQILQPLLKDRHVFAG